MIIDKIEKFSQLSFAKQNILQTKAALQTCFYNLKNLKKIVEGNDRQVHTVQNKIKPFNQLNQRNSMMDRNITLPEISITNARSLSLLAGFHNQTSRDFKSTSQQNYLDSFAYTKSISPKYHQSLLKNARINELIKSSQQLKKKKRDNKEKINKISSSPSKQNAKEQGKKKIDFRKKNIRIQKVAHGLQKNQRYFQQNDVKISQQMVNKLGLYQASNIYKVNNIQKFLKEGYQQNFKPVINLKFATFSLCNRNQFFLTDNSYLPEINDANSYLDHTTKVSSSVKKEELRKKIELSDKKQCKNHLKTQNQNSKDYNLILQQQKLKQQEISEQLQRKHDPNRIMQWILTIEGYQIIKNQQFLCFKKHNIEDWSEINFILQKIKTYLKKVKISLLSFKFQKQVFLKQLWSCARVEDKILQKLLKIKLKVKNQEQGQQNKTKTIRLFPNRAQIIKQLVMIWRDRKNLQIMKRNKQRQRDMLVWLCLRMIAKRNMNVARKKSKSRAKILNQKLKNGDWDYQVQIHIPSFSQSQFVRETTQYMEHYQNMFYHLWKSTNKQFVLIIPAINQTILKIFQQKIKLNKNITLICPESHELYPKSLPLSACLLYSKDALCKVKKILQGKKGVIIPGRRASQSSMYQQYLSDLLNCPLFCTFNVSQFIGDNKKLWLKYQIPTSKFANINPKSNISEVIQILSQLICDNPKTKIWILKMNGQFNGRGFAKFDAGSSKKIKQMLALQNCQQVSVKQQSNCSNTKVKTKLRIEIKRLIIQYLQTHFRLKLKINFQNCIFRVDQYIQKFLQKGGVIEQFVQDCQTYEFCYKLQPGYLNYSHLFILDELQQQKYISWTQNYQIDFVNKVSLFFHQNLPKILKDFSKKLEKVLKNQKYLGFISVSVLYNEDKQQYYGLQIKPYMTINSSMSYFLRIFNKKRKEPTNRRNGNLISHRNIQTKHQISQLENNSNSNGLIFLFIPFIIFADVDQIARCEFIQNLVVQSWDSTSSKLFSSNSNEQSDNLMGSLYVSLGLTLGLLIYGKSSQLKKMKRQAIKCARQLSDKIQNIKLYRGKKEVRDVYQFGDLIRAISKIKC